MNLTRYNVRVYGLCFNDAGEVLLTDERRGGYRMTKFPGGGHELGEGVGDCLKREFMEELSLEVELQDLFYINDFLQISAFNPKDQIISIYYTVKSLTPLVHVPIAATRFAFDEDENDAQTFRWVHPSEIDAEELTFPIDKIVLGLLQKTSALPY
jgi:8-oxo-dGTP diphosphatase